MTTARQLVTRAYRKAGILARGQTLTAEEANDGLAELNAMLGLWSNSALLIYARTLESFPLVAGTSVYTIGSGGDFNTARPLFIARAYLRNGTTDYPVSVVSEEAIAAVPSKSQGNMPAALAYDGGFPLGKIRLDYPPSETYTLFLLTEKELTSIATLDTSISMPPGWEDVLVYNLALRFFAEYGQEPDQMTVKTAMEGRAMIEKANLRNKPTDWAVTGVVGNVLNGWIR